MAGLQKALRKNIEETRVKGKKLSEVEEKHWTNYGKSGEES